MGAPQIIKVTATMNGHRYTASLSGDGVLLLGQGRVIATGRFVGGRFVDLRPSPPDFVIPIPTDELDVVEQLAAELRAATAAQDSDGAAVA